MALPPQFQKKAKAQKGATAPVKAKKVKAPPFGGKPTTGSSGPIASAALGSMVNSLKGVGK